MEWSLMTWTHLSVFTSQTRPDQRCPRRSTRRWRRESVVDDQMIRVLSRLIVPRRSNTSRTTRRFCGRLGFSSDNIVCSFGCCRRQHDRCCARRHSETCWILKAISYYKIANERNSYLAYLNIEYVNASTKW